MTSRQWPAVRYHQVSLISSKGLFNMIGFFGLTLSMNPNHEFLKVAFNECSKLGDLNYVIESQVAPLAKLEVQLRN